jgi:hypothetical protein
MRTPIFPELTRALLHLTRQLLPAPGGQGASRWPAANCGPRSTNGRSTG